MKDFISFGAGVLAALIFATAQLDGLEAAQGGRLAQATQATATAGTDLRLAAR